MKIEELRADQFDELLEFPDKFKPDPKRSIAIVVRDGPALVGRIFLVEPCHIEGPYIRESHRNGTVGARLIREAETTAKEHGVTKLFAYAVSSEIEDYLARLGYKPVPMTVWSKELI